MTAATPTLLYIDDDEALARLVKRGLTRLGFNIIHAASGGEGLDLLKRGGKADLLDLTKTVDVAQVKARELVALDDALNALAEVDPRKSRIVELRFFGGLSVKETAEVVKVSSDTVMRDWKLSKAWLFGELSA